MPQQNAGGGDTPPQEPEVQPVATLVPVHAKEVGNYLSDRVRRQQLPTSPLAAQPGSLAKANRISTRTYERYQERLAQQIEVATTRTADMFRYIAPVTVQQVPMTTTEVTVTNQDEAAAQWMNESVLWYSTVYGNEAMASFVASHLIEDPVAFNRTMAVLQDIAGLPHATSFVPRGDLGAAPTAEITQENFAKVMADPAAFQALSGLEQNSVTSLAQELADNLAQFQPGDSSSIDQFNRVVAVARDGYATVLDQQEQQALALLVQQANSGTGGATTDLDPLFQEKLGITQIRQLGGGVLVLDKDWAKANPEEALATKMYLEAQYPTATIALGEQGILGTVLDKFGSVTDYLTAGVGAALHQLREGSQRLGTSDEEAQATLARVAEAERSIDSGVIPRWVQEGMDITGGLRLNGEVDLPVDSEGAKLYLEHLREENTFEFGLGDFWNDVKKNTRPEVLGFGIADNYTASVGLLPGDPNYEMTHMAVGMVAQFVADPSWWGPAVIGGINEVRGANALVKLHATDEAIDAIRAGGQVSEEALQAMRDVDAIFPTVSRSWIHQSVAAKLARYPEEVVQTSAYINTINRLHTVAQTLGTQERFVTYLTTTAKMAPADAQRFAKIAFGPIGREIDTTVAFGKDIGEARAAFGVAMMDNMLGAHAAGTLNDVFEISDRLSDVNRELAAARTAEVVTDSTDLLARQHYLDDVLHGEDNGFQPVQGFVSGRTIRRIERQVTLDYGAPTRAERVVASVEDTVRHLPGSLFTNYDAMRAAAEANGKAGTWGAVQNLFGEFRHFWHDAGYGGVVLPLDATAESYVVGVRQAEKALAAARSAGDAEEIKRAQALLASTQVELVSSPQSSIKTLYDIAEFNRIPRKEFMEMIQPYVNGHFTGNRPAFYQWYKKTWTEIHDRSRILDALGRQEMGKLMDVAVEDRRGSQYTQLMGDYADRPVAAGTLETLDSAGHAYTIPSLEADFIGAFHTPDLATMREYATITGRTMKKWQALGGPTRKLISAAHGGVARTWRSATSLWRTSVLLGRMPAALPTRIIGEQQLRLAAFDYTSAFYHPMEWFESTTWGSNWLGHDAAFFEAAGDPIHALGSTVDNLRPRLATLGNRTVRLVNRGARGEQVEERVAFFRSYATEVAKYHSSRSVRDFRLVNNEIVDAPSYLDAIRADEQAWSVWGPQFDLTQRPGVSLEDTYRISSESMERDMRQLVGEGDQEAQNFIKTAIKLGHAEDPIGGRGVVTVGSKEYASVLEELQDAGRWQPGKQILPRTSGDYLPSTVTQSARNFANKAFKWFYSAPDLATSRVPLYRQILKREYGNMLKYGYSPEHALEVARATAAASTADILFTIGAHTSGEMFMKSIMPFFPAWRELGTTWIYRIPQRIGGLQGSRLSALGWAVGATALSRRADIILRSFEELGIVHKESDGTLSINAGVFAPAIRWLTGTDAQFEVKIPVSSLAGILPIPFDFATTDEEGRPLPWYERLRGLLPTIGGPSVGVLAALKTFAPELFSHVEDWATMFGANTPIGPAAVEQLWLALTGSASPLVWGRTEELINHQQTFSIIDGMRLSFNESPPPLIPADYDSSLASAANYMREWQAWRENLVNDGMKYAQGIHLFRLGLGSLMPFSVRIEDEDKAQIGALFDLINTPGIGMDAAGVERTDLYLPVLSATLAAYPELGPYMSGKTLDKRHFDDPYEDMSAFMETLDQKDGRYGRTPDEWALFAYGMQGYSLHMARVAQIRERAGQTSGEVLMNFGVADELDAENERWNAFLDFTDHHTNEYNPSGNQQSFRSMFDAYQQNKATLSGETPKLTLDQQRLLDFNSSMKQYAKFFDYNRDNVGEYSKMKAEAYDALFSSLGAPSDLTKGISWWFDEVASPYYDKLNVLYGKLDEANDRQQGLIFTDIRKLTDKYNNMNLVNPRFEGTFPTPEEYTFAKKSPQEQRENVAHWAALPSEYLTEFQRQQVGYDISDDQQAAVTKYVNYYADKSSEMKQYEFEHNISTSSSAHDNLKAYLGQLAQDKAKELGVTDEVASMNAPIYQKVGDALDLHGTPGWNKALELRQTVIDNLHAQGYVPDSTTVQGVKAREHMTEQLDALRKKDPHLDAALTTIANGVGHTNHYELTNYLFFDMTFNP